MINSTITKAAELKLLDDFISSLPAGYVRDILAELRPQFQRQMDQDICFVWSDIDRIAGQVMDLQKQVKDSEDYRDKLSAQIAGLKRTLANMIRDFETIQGDAMTIHRIACEKAQSIRSSF